ncbi:hypothetical protein GGI15_000651 [Coemansia interrupta]|uniref:Serine/threonine-protein kinase ATR n=1 Tax=Coemansia interrupta TaxID=1126814 RepID=A0A9W8LNP2_9FUNG|nr:hypothetical protein GGI15_000651 [Coemansia interrupta]
MSELAAQKIENGLNRVRAAGGQPPNLVLAGALALNSPFTQTLLDEILAVDGNFDSLATFSLRRPWDHVALNHFRAAASLRLDDASTAYTHQLAAYDAFLQMLVDLPRWLTSTLYVMSKDLVYVARRADQRMVAEGRRAVLIEEATRRVNQGFSLCLTDREPRLSASRKWGTYRMANLLFALYLRQHAYKLCTSMIHAIRTAELPPLDHFAISDHITFRYYRGMLAFRAENYAAARDDFVFAFTHCHKEARRNKTRVLIYLVPLMMVEGRMPDERALRAYPRVRALYGDFVRAAVAGNVGMFDRLLQEKEHDLAAVGTILAVEHVRKVAMRQLFYKIYLIGGRSSRIAFETFKAGLAVAGLSLETIHVEALLADMIHAGYIKGYLAHDHNLVVLSKQDPFPKRLRNEAPDSPVSWTVPQISEDRKCAEHLSAILQRGYGNSLARSMDTAVQLVQNLKHLQSFDTPYSRNAFDALYAGVLDHVGKVIDHIKNIDRANSRDTSEEESTLNSFAGVYQYLIEVIAKHAESISLIATTISPRAYMSDCVEWTQAAFAWSLSQTSDTQLRLAAWSLFPLFSMRIAGCNIDDTAALAMPSRVTVSDSDDLLEVVAHSLGYVACARSGRMDLKSNPASICIAWGLTDKPVPIATYTRGIVDLYTCSACDRKTASQESGTMSPGRSSSLSSWVPYWFLTSSNQRESTSLQYVRGVTRFIRHAPVEDISLRSSSLGQGLIRRLSSSSREMRLAAVEAVVAYSIDHAEDPKQVARIKRTNRLDTIQCLQDMVAKLDGPRMVEETFELVAGGVGCACGLPDDTLSSVMPFLIGYYCNDNIFLRAVAMEQILSIAQQHAITPARLLSLYASSIACTLSDTLDQATPRPFINCLQILDLAPRQFISTYQDRIVPHLVATGNENALRKVAEILDERLPVLCVNQAPVVFVKIFLMDDQLMHQALLRFVGLISAGTSNSNGSNSGNGQQQIEVNIPSLLRSCSVKLIFRLVLALGNEDPVLRKRARSALLTVQNILGRSTGDEQQGISNIVQQSVDNMKDVSKNESPRPGKPAGPLLASSDMADFLSRHILGVMAYMNELLRDTEADIAGRGDSSSATTMLCQDTRTRRRGLRAIGELVVLLGPRLTPHINNIVSSLMPSLHGPLASTTLRSWVVLADSLSKTALTVSQINSLIVPLLTAFFATSDQDARTTAADAISQVVAIHRSNIKAHCDRVCPVPDDPLLESPRAVVQAFFARKPFRNRLLGLSQMLKAKDSTIVFCASREICLMLQQNEQQILAWKQLFSKDGMGIDESIIGTKSKNRSNAAADARLLSNMVELLRAACGHTANPHRLGTMALASCAACLATIGVIDDRELDVNAGSGLSDSTQMRMLPARVYPTLDVMQDHDEQVEFACTLIVEYLVQMFAMAPTPSAQLCAAYSIQELLRLAGFTSQLLAHHAESIDSDDPHTSKTSGARGTRSGAGRRPAARNVSSRDEKLCQRWGMIPSAIRDVLAPLLDSKYTIQSSGRRKSHSDARRRRTCIQWSTTYIAWLRAWIIELVAALSESNPVALMLKACTSAIKESSADMLIYLLPQVAYQYCLSTGSAKHKDKAIVIDDDDDDNSKDSSKMTVDDPDDPALRHIALSEIQAVFANGADKSAAMPADQLRLCKEVCLDLLDSFSNHIRTRQAARVSGKRNARSDSKYSNTTPEEETLLSLVGSVSHDVIAQVAVSCHQYERAVLHTELALREKSFGKYPTLFRNVDDSSVAAIQELCFSMGDVDGVIGASLCRKQTDHKLAIRKYEIEGNWSHALIGHESLLRAQPDNEEYQKSWISCLQNMGQWEGAWATSKELFTCTPRTEAEQELNSACYAAAWRLGKWDWVQGTLDDSTNAIAADSTADSQSHCRHRRLQHQSLPDFNALNCAMLFRIGRDHKMDLLSKLDLPLPIDSLRSVMTLQSDTASGPFANLISMALASIGRSVVDSVRTRTSSGESSYAGYVSISNSQTSSEVHAHMVGDIAVMASHLSCIGYSGDQDIDCLTLANKLSELFEHWRRRIMCLPPVYAIQEPVLMLHSRLYDVLLDHLRANKSHATCIRSEFSSECICAESIIDRKVRTSLQAAQLARMAGFRATAMGILVHSELTCAASPALRAMLQTEHAHILWDEGHAADAMSALVHVTNSLQEYLSVPPIPSISSDSHMLNNSISLPSARNSKGSDDRLSPQPEIESAYVRAALPLLDWQVETKSQGLSEIRDRYEQIIKIQESDRAYYSAGRIYDVLYSVLENRSGSRSSSLSKSRSSSWDKHMLLLQCGLIRNYLRSILYSPRYLFQALPRLLTVWFEFSTISAQIPERADPQQNMLGNLAKKIDSLITNMTTRLPIYNFLVVLSQLASRICHENQNVFRHIQSIILRLLELYPQQTLWKLMAVKRSTFEIRRQKCETILDMARSNQIHNGQQISTLINQADKLTDELLALCNAVPSSRNTTVMHMSRDFQRLAASTNLDIIVPLQHCLVPNLPENPPNSDNELALSASATGVASGLTITSLKQQQEQRAMLHQPFSSELPTISSFDNEIAVMLSLQRPKRFTIVGSDGKRYRFLGKPKDDLRKDARLMEFNSMINRLLSTNSETNKRGLHIRTYAVVPLNEDCGLIQWIAPSTAIRQQLLELYKAHNVPVNMSQVKTILEKPTLPGAETFVKVLLPMFPSVLHEWFLRSFPDPPRWLASRSNFTRSAAVMSMVGHILGLGDRHCENILLDESTGGVMHVDFNCLFEKGMTLEKPEKVPFRLTHNMVDAMGVTGYEGSFRKTCEMTLRLLRENRDALMSVLESFLHDPLLEWKRRETRSSRASAANTAQSARAAAGGQPNEQAAKCLGVINRKLQGIPTGVAPLSVEGHVDLLIRDATRPDLLFQMYVGWAAFM